jgi:hypothetical protein
MQIQNSKFIFWKEVNQFFDKASNATANSGRILGQQGVDEFKSLMIDWEII